MENFREVIGYDHIKHELNRIIDCINNKEKYQNLGVNVPHGLLLFGKPGLGKTLFAKSFLEAVNRNKYIIRKDRPDGEFVNSINKTITEAMENTPSVVLLDDIDKFSNNDDKHTKSDEFVVIQSLIDDAKNKDVFFIATANDLDDMPESLLRTGRFDTKIEVESPTLKDATKIIHHYLENKVVADDIDCEEIARILDGDSCAVLESVMNEAGLIAGFNNHSEITMDDIIKATLRVIFNSPENLDNKTEYQLKTASYHEAGHALVAEYLEPGSVNLVSVSNYFGGKGGVTSIKNSDDYWADFTHMENRVIILLAGRASTELFFNKLDIGTTSDLSRSTRIVSRFYEDYKAFTIRDDVDLSASDSSRVMRDMWINIKLEEYYQRAKDIIFKHKDKLEEIAKMLMDKQVLTKKDISNILA